MPKLRNWVEVAEACAGPTREDGRWSIVLGVTICRSYARGDRRRITRRRQDFLLLSARTEVAVLLAADAFLARTDVIVVAAPKETSHAKREAMHRG